MPSRPTINRQNRNQNTNKSSQPRKTSYQHGTSSHRHILSSHPARHTGENSLVGIPGESLTHITSFLDPPSLFSLALTSKRFHEHISDDNTWHRAYAYQFLGILPEGDLRHGENSNGRSLMFRRAEGTWRKEYLARWDMRRRWERSRNAAITHVPHHSPVTGMLLMPTPFQAPSAPPALLACSLQYGIVSRSYLLNGKVLRGYLDAGGTLNGLGIGNPNAEFSQDLVKCALTAEGGTAKILWGFRNGTVAVTTAAKAMEGGRPVAARWVRCSLDEAHEGMVTDAIWANGHAYCVTGGADGRVKLWDARRVACLWTSELNPGQLIRESCSKVAVDIANGMIAGMLKNGETVVWSGFAFPEDPSSAQVRFATSREIRVSAPKLVNVGPLNPGDIPKSELKDAHIHCESPNSLSLLLYFNDHPFVYRSNIDLVTGEVIQVPFGDASGGSISAIYPLFSSKSEEGSSLILIGDNSGCVSLYPWERDFTAPRSIPIQPTRKLEAHEDGAVTAIAWSPVVLVTGSAQGSVKVWDSLSFAHLRSFSSPVARPVSGEWEPVSQIIVERDLLVISVGRRVMAWVAGPVSREKPMAKIKHPRASKANPVAKWHQQVEMFRDIAESRRDLKHEQSHVRRVLGREREQQSTLTNLGLSEAEAVEYVLMLSRDEEEARRQRQGPADQEEEGFLVGDFDDIETSSTSNAVAGPSGATRTPPTYGPPLGGGAFGPSRSSRPLVTIPSSNVKVQVSPRFRPEPMAAGVSISPLTPSGSTPGSVSSSLHGHLALLPATEDLAQFPSISSTPTTTSASASLSASTPPRRSVSGSPESTRSASAWSTPLRMTRSEGPSSPRSHVPLPNGNGSGASLPRARGGIPAVGSSLLSAGFARRVEEGGRLTGVSRSVDDQEEEDLRYAIELSLAETRSREEGV